ncbi:MAG: OmpH family outer membrane protein [Vulcanimicrobiaceae bacterium]
MLCIAGMLVAGCSHSSESASGSAAPVHASGAVGYVRMDDLIKRHPLYGQLARLDDDMEAIRLRAVGESLAHSGDDITREEAQLQHQLDEAADRTRKTLAEKQADYSARERAAMNAALVAAGSVSGPGGNSIVGGVNRQARLQAQSVAAAAQANLQTYRSQLVEQDSRAFGALEQSLNERAERSYRAKVAQLQKNEADFALQQATADANERLSLRTKLDNLALDETARADIKAQLDALERKESDALGMMKRRDEATLAALQTQLHSQLQAELQTQAAAMRKQTLAKLGQRELQTRQGLVGQLNGAPLASGSGMAVPAALPPDMRARLDALHKQYQQNFDRDAQQTVAEFQKTRSELTERFETLHGIDVKAQAGAKKQLDSLAKQRRDLYDQMVAQIESEVRMIAQKRGVNVVFSEVAAPAGGVDLTDDAAKDIESLHE